MGEADVGVAGAARGAAPASHAGVTAAAAPMYRRVPVPAVHVERHGYVEIRSKEGSELVTVIELLSPSNKYAGADRENYLRKRRQLFER